MSNNKNKVPTKKPIQSKSVLDIKTNKGKSIRNKNYKKNNKSSMIILGSVALLITVLIAVFIFKGNGVSGTDTSGNAVNSSTGSSASDIVFNKSDITSTAKFYPATVDGVKMEVLAAKAPDGTIRTAMNTCQVCYDSGRGYYIQQGDELVCQNCKNRFKLSDVEKIKGGCNPVPILDENKTDNGTSITISGNFLEQNKGLFLKWKKSQ